MVAWRIAMTARPMMRRGSIVSVHSDRATDPDYPGEDMGRLIDRRVWEATPAGECGPGCQHTGGHSLLNFPNELAGAIVELPGVPFDIDIALPERLTVRLPDGTLDRETVRKRTWRVDLAALEADRGQVYRKLTEMYCVLRVAPRNRGGDITLRDFADYVVRHDGVTFTDLAAELSITGNDFTQTKMRLGSAGEPHPEGTVIVRDPAEEIIVDGVS